MSNILKIRENKTSVEIRNNSTEKSNSGEAATATKDAFDDLLQLLNMSSPIASASVAPPTASSNDTAVQATNKPVTTAISLIKTTPLSHSSPNLRSSSSDLDADDSLGAVGGAATNGKINGNGNEISSDDEGDTISGENFVEYAETMDHRLLTEGSRSNHQGKVY